MPLEFGAIQKGATELCLNILCKLYYKGTGLSCGSAGIGHMASKSFAIRLVDTKDQELFMHLRGKTLSIV